MAFVKHIGKHGDKKVAVVYRKVPGEDHMCLVAYTEVVPSHFHDSIINTIESAGGQQAENLADALDRAILPDGRNTLHALHKEGYIKKVPTNQVVITPNAKSHIRLDELNNVLDDLATGGEAAEKLAEMDKNAGLVDPTAKKKAETVNEAVQTTQVTADPMSDEGIAQTMIDQANRMAAEAQGLVTESERMLKEAYAMAPSLKPKRARATATKKAAPKKATTKVKA